MAEKITATSGAADKPIQVLFLHPFSVYGGSTKSLVEMFSALPPGAVRGTCLAPSGLAEQALRSAGMSVIPVLGLSQWDNTRIGYYRGLRWIVLLRELLLLYSTLKAVRHAKNLSRYDIIHCNEITGIPVAFLAIRLLKIPLVMHVRSLQHPNTRRLCSRVIYSWMRNNVSRIVVIDEAVKRTLPTCLPVDIVYNCMAVPNMPMRRIAEGEVLTIAIIGVLHRMKGVYELIATMCVLRERGVRVRLMVVGENSRDLSGWRSKLYKVLNLAHDVKSELQAYVRMNNLDDMVEFTGFVSDITTIYKRVDVVCFPSHLDAPGRPVFEAALYGLPAIVAMKNPTTDVIIHRSTGICIKQPDIKLLADAIEQLALDRELCRALGHNARELAIQRFESGVCAKKMLRIYEEVINMVKR